MKFARLTSLFLMALLAGPVACGSMQANRSVRAAGYPVERTSVERRMGAKVVYVYIGRAITDQERQDIKTRVMGAVPNATEIVVYPLPSANQSPAGATQPVQSSGEGRPVNPQ